MPFNLTFGEIFTHFRFMVTAFLNLKNTTPFEHISCRPPVKDLDTYTSHSRRLEKYNLPYTIPDTFPDESDFVAIITLSSNKLWRCADRNDKFYEFKIRADGSIYFEPSYYYVKQPRDKWLRLVDTFILNLPMFGKFLRHMKRTDIIKQELIASVFKRNPDILFV